MTQWLIGILVLFPAAVFAGEVSQEGIDQIRVSGRNINIELSSNKGGLGVVQWSGPAEAYYQMEKIGNELIIKPRSESNLMLNVKVVTSLDKKVHVSAFDLNVSATNYQGQLHLSSRKIAGSIKNSKGNLQIYSPKGQFAIQSHAGDMDVEAYQLSLTVRDSVGALEVYNFSGENLVEGHSGRIKLRQLTGTGKVARSEGSFSAEIGRSSLNLSEYKGRLDIDSKEGQLSLGLLGEPEAEIRAKAGKVNVQLAGGNVWLNIQTVSGEIYGPGNLKPFRVGKYKFIKGRTQGSGRGQVIVRSEEAQVLVK